MKDVSKIIFKTFNNVVKIYEDISSLLEDVSLKLDPYGYKCFHGNTIGTEQSKDIRSPKRWITPYASKYFSNENDNSILVVCVFLADAKWDPMEPIIVYGKFKMKADESGEMMKTNYWSIKEAWFNQKNDMSLNTPHLIENKSNYKSACLQAIKLDEVNNQEDIDSKIVSPLIAFE
jgi:hypothetical protein